MPSAAATPAPARSYDWYCTACATKLCGPSREELTIGLLVPVPCAACGETFQPGDLHAIRRVDLHALAHTAAPDHGEAR